MCMVQRDTRRKEWKDRVVAGMGDKKIKILHESMSADVDAVWQAPFYLLSCVEFTS